MAGDDLVWLARGHQLKDLTFAGCQQGHTNLQRGAFEALLVGLVIPMQRSLNAFEQGVFAQRLLDEVKGSRSHRYNCQRNVAVAGNEYNRDTPAADIELLLQFEPAHLGHSHIEQQAATASRV